MTQFARYLRPVGPFGLDPWEDDPFLGRVAGPWGIGAPVGKPTVFVCEGEPTVTYVAPKPIPQLKAALVATALEEWERWDKGRKKEGNVGMADILVDYWLTGTGTRVQKKDFKSHAWQEGHPWSAAFISWVMRKAGGGDRFRYSIRHAVYIHWAKLNREANNESPFKAYATDEVLPEPGDLVCKARAGSGATYKNLKADMKSHCDYVIAVEDGKLATIGGNVSDSVSKTMVTLDKSGHVKHAGYFAVIKIEDEE